MPELPEVETMVRCIAPIVGRQVVRVFRPRNHRQPIGFHPSWEAIKRRILGAVVTSVARRGKRVVVHLNQDQCLVIEPRMTGLVMLRNPPNESHLRMVIDLICSDEHQQGAKQNRASNKLQLLFWDQRGLGQVHIMSRDEFAKRLGPSVLGPDALTISRREFAARLASTSRPVKPALMDQQLLAGIGNLYASEMLHRAGINPLIPADRLSKSQTDCLWRAMRAVLREAIAHQGSTLRDGTYRISADEIGDHQNHLRVYQRAGSLCSQCRRHEIVRIVQVQRSTFYCPGCQPMKGDQ